MTARVLSAAWRFQAFRFELDPNNITRSALASHVDRLPAVPRLSSQNAPNELAKVQKAERMRALGPKLKRYASVSFFRFA